MVRIPAFQAGCVGSIPITRSKTPFLKAAVKNAEKPCVSRVFGVF